MNDTLSKILIFTAGAGAGSLVTWKIIKDKYARIAQEEIESVREMYAARKAKEDKSKEDDRPKTFDKPDLKEYASILNDEQYSDVDEKEVTGVERPYVITPGEFDELYGYEAITLTYYADGVLVDDMNEPIEDIDEIVGIESLEHFGEFEPDSVYVRNDTLKCDYEILLDTRNYSDVVSSYLNQSEEE